MHAKDRHVDDSLCLLYMLVHVGVIARHWNKNMEVNLIFVLFAPTIANTFILNNLQELLQLCLQHKSPLPHQPPSGETPPSGCRWAWLPWCWAYRECGWGCSTGGSPLTIAVLD